MNRSLYILTILLLVAGACKKSQDQSQQPLTVNGFLPGSGIAHTLVTLTGTGFGRDSLHTSVTFNGVKAPFYGASDTSLVVIAPDGGTTGPVVVTVDGKQVTAGTYTYQLLSLHSASPLNGPAGTSVVLTGAGFSGHTGPATVTFNGRAAAVTSVNDTTLKVAVPDSAGTGPIIVRVDGEMATGPVFAYQAISFISPVSGGAGTQDSIHGSGFGTDASKAGITYNGVTASVLSVSDTMLVVKVPSGVQTGPVAVTVNGQKAVGPVFTVVAAPVITSVTPSSGLPGASVTIVGKNFSAVISQNQVDFNGAAATVTAATTTQLTVTVPANASTGHLNVLVNGQPVQGPVFSVQALNITLLTPDNGLDGTQVVITGNGFSPSLTGNQVFFNGVAATVTAATANQLTVTAPAGVTTGPVSVQTGGLTATGPIFSRAGVKTIYTSPNISFSGIAVDASGNIYVTGLSTDTYTSTNNIMKLSPDGSTMTVFAGSAASAPGNQEGNASAALFNGPAQLTFDHQGNLYVFDAGNSSIRMITPSGNVTTVTTGVTGLTSMVFGPQNELYAGTFTGGNVSGVYVLNNGVLSPILTNYAGAGGLTIDGSGNIFFYAGSEAFGQGVLLEIAKGTTSYKTAASGFGQSGGIDRDPSTGNILMLAGGAFYSFDVSTLARTTLYQYQSGGLTDGTLAQARFLQIAVMTVDNTGAVYILDGGYESHYSIRKISFR